MFKYLLYKFGEFCVRHLPVKLSYRWAQWNSDMQYLLSPRDRRSVRNNLRIILNSERDLPDQTRAVFRYFGRYLVDFFRVSKNLDESFIERSVQKRGVSVIEDCLREGRGAILVSAHIGNWELGGMVLAKLGFSITAVALPHKERLVNNLFNAQREIHGIKIVPPSLAVRKCMEALRASQCVALIGDRDFGSHGLEMDFLGRRAMIPKGPAVFAIKTGAPIVPCFMLYNDNHTYSLEIETPIHPSTMSEGTVEDFVLLSLMKKYISVIEQKVRQYPTQWLMFREFWKQ